VLTSADLLWARGLRLYDARLEDAFGDLLAAGQLLRELKAPNPAYAAWRRSPRSRCLRSPARRRP
jgi:hypothetical protein